MKNISSILQNTRKLLDENSPVILTGAAIVGTVATAYLTFRGTQKATDAIAQEAFNRNVSSNPEAIREITNQEKFLLTWKFYAPSAVAVVGTSTCMIMATRIGLNRTAALGAALVVAERTNGQYMDKVKETFGEKKHTQVVDAIATDKVNATPLNSSVALGAGEQWFFDAWTARYFRSNMEAIKQAVNDFNQEMLYGRYASLNSFYKRIGLDFVYNGDDIGWDSKHFLEISYTSVLKDGVACAAITFDRNPMPTFRGKIDEDDV